MGPGRPATPQMWSRTAAYTPLGLARAQYPASRIEPYTDDPRYARLAGWAYSWFLGRNRVGARLYAEWSGGCNDGLSATAANPNQW
jgi:hypothetical protein